MRFYCLEHDRDIYANANEVGRVKCPERRHYLPKHFPHEPYWEHCRDCAAFWCVNQKDYRYACPACKQGLEIVYLCHNCQTFSLKRLASLETRDRGEETCAACRINLTDLRWHYCLTLGKSFQSRRESCPFCSAEFFPATSSELLTRLDSAQYRFTILNESDVGYPSLIAAVPGNRDESQFLLLAGTRDAIVVPRHSSREMIEKEAETYWQLFDWAKDWSGDLIVERPAICERDGNTWKLKEPGRLTGSAFKERMVAQSSYQPVLREGVRTASSAEYTNDANTEERTSLTIDALAVDDQSWNSAKSFYRHLVSGGAVTNTLVYLSSEKSAVKAGLRDRDEFLREVVNKQGTFILFVDEDKGWVLPNPSLLFRPKALATLFPDLTEDQYNNFRQDIEPVPVVRVGQGRWEAKRPENGSRSTQTNPVTKIESAPAETVQPSTFPISVADYLKAHQNSQALRPDFRKGILVNDANGEGEFLLVMDSAVAGEPQNQVIVPRVARFAKKQVFDIFYEKYYDCAKPSAGDLWIIDPALVSKVEGGWQLYKKGVLEVRERQKDKIHPVSDFSPAVARLRLVVAGVIGLLFLAIGVFWLVKTTTFKPRANENTNQGPTGNNNPPAHPPSAPPGMAYVPSGTFLMGRDDGTELERPAHSVSISKAFFIDLSEVTCKEYEGFLSNNPKTPIPIGWKDRKCPAGKEQWPVSGVDWYEAEAYAKWKGKRLPTEQEWEYVARGGDKNLLYPWGNSWKENAANAGSASPGHIVAVGSYPDGAVIISGARVVDMVGNVWEWTSSEIKPYGRSLPQRLSNGEKVSSGKVIRGGAWNGDKTITTTTYRMGYPPRGASDYSNTGFRCVMDAPSQ